MRPLLFLVALSLCSSGALLAQTDKLKLELLLDMESVGGARLSPDGQEIVFTRSWVNKLEDRTQSALWIMNADGSKARFLIEGSSPRWSPDGMRIAFTKKGKPKGSQIYVRWRGTSEVTQLTHLTQSPSNIRWSPDSKRIAFTMQVPEKSGFPIKLPRKPKGAKWAPEPRVITRLNYRRDQRGYRPQGYRHLFVVDATFGGTPRQVTSGDHDHGRGEWTPDGKSLLFSGLLTKDADWQVRESEVYRVDVDTGKITQLTTRVGPDGGPKPSPNGRLIAYSGYDKNTDTYNVAKIHVMNADGTGSRVLADLDRRARIHSWSKNSTFVYFTVSGDGQTQVHKVDLAGNITQVTRGNHRFGLSDVGKDGTLVGTRSSPSQPADIYSVHPSGALLTQLTRVNDDVLSRVTLGNVEEIKYRSVDDFEIQGWIVKPPDFDRTKKYPLILQIHGGPHGMYGVDFSFERQQHAAEGFVVLYTNPRGSSGYGKKFGNAINNAYPSKDYDDLMRGVDRVIERGYIDANNLFVYGGSGGGVLTCWIVGHTDRFRAAVSMYPVTNWVSFVGTTDGPYWYTNFKKLPWEDITEHWDRSPLKYVGNVKTPTMLLTGELDLRTPMSQTEEYYQALKLRKVDTVMVRVPDEYHGASRRHVSNRLRRILYVQGWFKKYMKKAPAAAEAINKGGK